MIVHATRAALIVASSLWFVVGHAQQTPTEELALRQALERVAAHNPELRAYLPRRSALAANRASAGLAPPLEASADITEFGGTNATTGFSGAETTLALSGVIELGKRPAARIGVVDARTELLAANQRADSLDAFAVAARHYVELAALQQELKIAKRDLELRTETRQAVAHRVQRGRVPTSELDRARAAQARARLEVGHIEHQLPTARVQLSALWGEVEPDFTQVDDDALFHPGTAGDFDALASSLERNPDLVRLARSERLAAAKLQLAQSNARGEVGWQAGVKRLEGSDSTALVAGVSIPLFSQKRATGDVNAARFGVEAARLDRDAARTALYATMFEAWQHRAHALEAFALLRDTVIPDLQSAVSSTRTAHRAGRYSYLELVAAQRELIDARLALLDAAKRAHLNRIELERLAGAPLRNTLPQEATSTANQTEDNDHEH